MRRNTRHITVLLVAFAMLVAACGAGDAEPTETTDLPKETTTTIAVPATTEVPPTTEAPPATRTVTHALGETEVPLEIERYIVLDENAALNMITLGVKPTVAFSFVPTEISSVILESKGVQLQESAAGVVNLEVVVGNDPDVIVGTQFVIDEIYMDLSAIAPTIVLPVLESWRDMISTNGDFFEKEEEAALVVELLEMRIAEVAEVVAENPTSVSILGAFGGMLFTPYAGFAVSEVVTATGVTRPAAQSEAPADPTFGYAVLLSPELLGDHNADHILLMAGMLYEPAVITGLPTFEVLEAVEAGNVTKISGEMWFGTFAFAIYWILADLEAIASGEGAVGTTADAKARWNEFQERLAEMRN